MNGMIHFQSYNHFAGNTNDSPLNYAPGTSLEDFPNWYSQTDWPKRPEVPKIRRHYKQAEGLIKPIAS